MISIVFGIASLIISSNLLINNVLIISKKLNLSIFTISVICYGIFTSFPELLISIQAANLGHGTIIVSNIIGSNIANFALILGTTAFLCPMKIQDSNSQGVSISFLIISIVFLNFVTHVVQQINWITGITFLVTFLLYMILLLTQCTCCDNLIDKTPINTQACGVNWSILMIFLSLAGMYLGPHLVISGVLSLSHSFGISNEFIGATIIAIGTSLPELAICMQAQYKQNPEMILGNIIGSNIFNTLFILGISSIIKPIQFPIYIKWDLLFMNVVSVIAIWTLSQKKISQKTGAIFLLLEGAYITYNYYFYYLL